MTIPLLAVIAYLLGMVILLILDDGHYKLDDLVSLATWPVMLPYAQIAIRIRHRRAKRRDL